MSSIEELEGQLELYETQRDAVAAALAAEPDNAELRDAVQELNRFAKSNN